MTTRRQTLSYRRAAALAAVSVTAVAPVVTGWTPAGAATTTTTARTAVTSADHDGTVPASQSPPAGDTCSTTQTGQASGLAPATTAAHADKASPETPGPYYGNPKVGVQVAQNAPGLCPNYTDASGDSVPDLGNFVIGATDDGPVPADRPATENPSAAEAGAPKPSCVTDPGSQPVSTVDTDLDGDCQMDPNGNESFPMQSTYDNFTFNLDSMPLGWVLDPDDPSTFEAAVSACGAQTAGVDGCSGTNPWAVQILDSQADVFNVIGIFRYVTVTVTSGVTGKPLPGVTVDLACAAPSGQPSDVCAAATQTAKTDADGVATIPGLYAPGVPVTVTESGLPAGYTSVTSSTTVPSPVTAATTTGAEINAAARAPVALTVSPTAPLATVYKTTPEDQALSVTGLGSATPSLGTLTVTGVGTPSHGTAVLGNDGTVTYTPDTGYVGTDSFTYTADPPGAGGTGLVDVTVTEVPPTAKDASLSTAVGTAVSVDLLPLTSAAAGNTRHIEAVGSATHGSVSLSGSRATYSPKSGYVGDDHFTYTVEDDHGGTATATVTVTIHAAAVATTTTTTTTTTVPTTSSTLPFTGFHTEQVGAGGLALVVAGALLAAGAQLRRNKRRPRHLKP